MEFVRETGESLVVRALAPSFAVIDRAENLFAMQAGDAGMELTLGPISRATLRPFAPLGEEERAQLRRALDEPATARTRGLHGSQRLHLAARAFDSVTILIEELTALRAESEAGALSFGERRALAALKELAEVLLSLSTQERP